MSARIVVLCLLSSIISTAASLKCQTCFATTEECRNEDMKLVECGVDEGHCLTFSLQSTMITPSISFSAKRCAKTEECSQGYYQVISVAGRYHQMKVACCESDGCNAAPLPLPGRDELKPSGFLCPGSYVQNGGPSEGKEPVICLGEEDQCINVSFSMTILSAFSVTSIAQGCATKTACSYPVGVSKQVNGLVHLNVTSKECQNAMGLEGWKRFFNAV
ncbi:phospholipase A2 inhibitor and Ly6/PLAUR domain-containing protein-like [Liasis olivaceus]